MATHITRINRDDLPLLELDAGIALSVRLMRHLEARGWVRRDQLAREMNVKVRVIRSAASHAGGLVLSGSCGLKLTTEATHEEVTASCRRLRSQISEMQRRLVETEKVWHSR